MHVLVEALRALCHMGEAGRFDHADSPQCFPYSLDFLTVCVHMHLHKSKGLVAPLPPPPQVLAAIRCCYILNCLLLCSVFLGLDRWFETRDVMHCLPGASCLVMNI